jgi:hypothetical protein
VPRRPACAAGYSGTIGEALRASVSLTRYQSSMATLHFGQRKAARQAGDYDAAEELAVLL